MTTKTNLFAKTVNKKFLIIATAVLSVLLVAAIIVSALCGINYGTATDDFATVTVRMDTSFYRTETQREALENACVAEFEEQGLSISGTPYYAPNPDTASNLTCEIMYTFENVDGVQETVRTAAENLATTFAAKTAENGEWYGYIVQVTSGNEVLFEEIAFSRAYWAIGAVALFAALSFAYVSLRQRSAIKGAVVAISSLVAAIVTAAVVLLTRIPVTQSTFYAVAASALLAPVFTLLTLRKVDALAEKKENADKPLIENVKAALVPKEITAVGVLLGVALVLVGAIATSATRWFALSALVGLDIALFTTLAIIPTCYALLKTRADANAKARTGYQGAKPKDKAESEVLAVKTEEE